MLLIGKRSPFSGGSGFCLSGHVLVADIMGQGGVCDSGPALPTYFVLHCIVMCCYWLIDNRITSVVINFLGTAPVCNLVHPGTHCLLDGFLRISGVTESLLGGGGGGSRPSSEGGGGKRTASQFCAHSKVKWGSMV